MKFNRRCQTFSLLGVAYHNRSLVSNSQQVTLGSPLHPALEPIAEADERQLVDTYQRTVNEMEVWRREINAPFAYSLRIERTSIERVLRFETGMTSSDQRVFYTFGLQIWYPDFTDIPCSTFHFIRSQDATILDTALPGEMRSFLTVPYRERAERPQRLVLGPDALAMILEHLCEFFYYKREHASLQLNFVCEDDPLRDRFGCNACLFDDAGAPVTPTRMFGPDGWQWVGAAGHQMRGEYFGMEERPPRFAVRALHLDIAPAPPTHGRVMHADSCSSVQVRKSNIEVQFDRVMIREAGHMEAVLPPMLAVVPISVLLESITAACSEARSARGKHLLPEVEVEVGASWEMRFQ